MRMFGGVDQHHAILIEKLGVAFHRNDEPILALEGNPRAAVRQDISAHGLGRIERRAHALTDFLVPISLGCGGIEARVFPERQFGNMRARIVAARDKKRGLGMNGFQ